MLSLGSIGLLQGAPLLKGCPRHALRPFVLPHSIGCKLAITHTAADVSAFRNALAATNLVLADASMAQTQVEVDGALSGLKKAFEALKQDHPELKNSHDANYGGVNHLTKFGDTVVIEFKGDIRDVTGFALNDKNYPLTSGGLNVYNITEDGNTIGTITSGSAVVTLPSAFSDRLANGTHKTTVFFADAIGTGSGTANLVVNRTTGDGDNGNGNGNDPGKGSAIPPQTGDGFGLDVVLVVAVVSLLVLIMLWVAGWRRRREE